MESDTSSRDTVTRCNICRIPINIKSSQYYWSPWTGLLIKRHLCSDCGNEFEIKTRSIEDRAKAHAHSKYIEWEKATRIAKDIKNRQLKMPGV